MHGLFSVVVGACLAPLPAGTAAFLRKTGLLLLALASLMTAACSHTITVTSSKHGHLQVGDEPAVPVGPQPTSIKVPVGVDPVLLRLRDKGTDEMTIAFVPRDDMALWVPVTAGIGACMLFPSCVIGSLLVANPFFLPSLALAAAVPNFAGACVSIISAPSWCTLPCATGGLIGGLSPLSMLMIAARPASHLSLDELTWVSLPTAPPPELPKSAMVY